MDNEILEVLKRFDYIFSNSKFVRPNSAFIALKGNNFDGHDFIKEAYEKGARLFLISDKSKWPKNLRAKYFVLPEKKLKSLYFDICHFVYKTREIFKNVKVIGITGTNGKTTTSFSLYYILKDFEKVGLIGTEEYILDKEHIPSFRTTPPLDYLLFLFKKAYEKNIKYIIMEVSSHALDQKRVYKIPFYISAFTNLSQDHLDYHKTLENYFISKLKIFFQTQKYGLINPYNFYSDLIKNFEKIYPCKILKLPLYKDKKILKIDKDIIKLNTNLIGDYNLENVAFAAFMAYLLKVDKDIIEEKIKNLKIPGRLEKVYKNIFIDYAHTPEGLKKVVLTLKNSFENRKILVLFGAGGNRDKYKRPMMLKEIKNLADKIILTMDNPRNEDDILILLDILEAEGHLTSAEKNKIYNTLKNKGIYEYSSKITLVRFRDKAIKYAIKSFKDYIILLAGKGNENYIEIQGKRYSFSDKKEVLKWL